MHQMKPMKQKSKRRNSGGEPHGAPSNSQQRQPKQHKCKCKTCYNGNYEGDSSMFYNSMRRPTPLLDNFRNVNSTRQFVDEVYSSPHFTSNWATPSPKYSTNDIYTHTCNYSHNLPPQNITHEPKEKSVEEILASLRREHNIETDSNETDDLNYDFANSQTFDEIFGSMWEEETKLRDKTPAQNDNENILWLIYDETKSRLSRSQMVVKTKQYYYKQKAHIEENIFLRFLRICCMKLLYVIQVLLFWSLQMLTKGILMFSAWTYEACVGRHLLHSPTRYLLTLMAAARCGDVYIHILVVASTPILLLLAVAGLLLSMYCVFRETITDIAYAVRERRNLNQV